METGIAPFLKIKRINQSKHSVYVLGIDSETMEVIYYFDENGIPIPAKEFNPSLSFYGASEKIKEVYNKAVIKAKEIDEAYRKEGIEHCIVVCIAEVRHQIKLHVISKDVFDKENVHQLVIDIDAEKVSSDIENTNTELTITN